MEGIQTINALKAVVSSLPAQTTIPSSELVMLYAADGTPIAKIARDDLVKAVASVMASNSQNTFSKLLGVQANGTPMGIGASDLASVLGVASNLQYDALSDILNITKPGIYVSTNTTLNRPSESEYYFIIANKNRQNEDIFILNAYETNTAAKTYTGMLRDGSVTWNRVYDDGILTDSTVLSSLASALGERQWTFKDSGYTLVKFHRDINEAAGCNMVFETNLGTLAELNISSDGTPSWKDKAGNSHALY
jgi:hypothetical protein